MDKRNNFLKTLSTASSIVATLLLASSFFLLLIYLGDRNQMMVAWAEASMVFSGVMDYIFVFITRAYLRTQRKAGVGTANSNEEKTVIFFAFAGVVSFAILIMLMVI